MYLNWLKRKNTKLSDPGATNNPNSDIKPTIINTQGSLVFLFVNALILLSNFSRLMDFLKNAGVPSVGLMTESFEGNKG